MPIIHMEIMDRNMDMGQGQHNVKQNSISDDIRKVIVKLFCDVSYRPNIDLDNGTSVWLL